ncbi:elongation factor P-like protein EfpL [Reinekea thalattae]|uniref:Elongation factor P-like protein n=1 Tax=Reinekea thalattae TaxID=2593301 RepID=A0A5C8Z6Y6_9GAMM|nr:elongation factor P-like protein YeiP [Reinekea thalattae]TXR53397.1 elongation factor P-like protein YeiP [Reinekea thalattae]
MPKAPDIKSGQVIELDNAQYIVKSITVSSPTARGAATLYKMLLNELKERRKKEVTFKGDDVIQLADFQQISVSYLFSDADSHTFMDTEDYSQHLLFSDDLGDQLMWIHEGMEGIRGLVVDDRLVAIELPQSVVKKITETSPSIKGASASARTKPAILEGGVTVQVPEYIGPGDVIKVNTETEKYMSRVSSAT